VQAKLTEIVAENSRDKGSLIPILQKVQEQLGYLSEETIEEIAKFTGIPASEIFGVASFYAQFYFTPRGKHTVKVCLGTACHVRGGQRIMDQVQKELGIKAGETTADYNFSLERVACFGCCALAPVMTVDKTVYPEMTHTKVTEILHRFNKEKI
jgi:NADH-quinone oxidoreductase subunit E